MCDVQEVILLRVDTSLVCGPSFLCQQPFVGDRVRLW